MAFVVVIVYRVRTVPYRTVRATCLSNLSPHLKDLNGSCDLDGGHASLRMPWDGGENSDGRGGVRLRTWEGWRWSASIEFRSLGELSGGWRAHARALWASCNQHARNARAKAHEDRFVGLGSAPVIWKCRVRPRLVSCSCALPPPRSRLR